MRGEACIWRISYAKVDRFSGVLLIFALVPGGKGKKCQRKTRTPTARVSAIAFIGRMLRELIVLI